MERKDNSYAFAENFLKFKSPMAQKSLLAGHKAMRSVSPTRLMPLAPVNCARYLLLISLLLKSIMSLILQHTLKAENPLDIGFFEV